MADWFVYQSGGAHLGPWSSERIAQHIADGQLPRAIYIGAPAGSRWLPAMDVPVIANAVAKAVELRSGRAYSPEPPPARPSLPPPLPSTPPAFQATPLAFQASASRAPLPGRPPAALAATVMMVQEDELEIITTDAPHPRASSVPPPLPSALMRGTLAMSSVEVVQQAVQIARENAANAAAKRKLDGTMFLPNGPTAEHLRGDKSST